MTYNPRNPNLIQIIRKYWPLLHTNRTLHRLFPNEPMIAFRRETNLRDMLVRAKIEYPPSINEKRMYKLRNTTCPVITCKYCKYIRKDQSVQSSFMCAPYKTRVECRISCLTTNVVYCITCQKCKTQYVGETKRQLKRRMYEHLRQIDKYGQFNVQTTPVSEHFNQVCKRPAKLTFQVLETIKADPQLERTTDLRRRRETYWILTLRTIEPFGMNIHV